MTFYVASAVAISEGYIISAGHNMEYIHLADEIIFTTQASYTTEMSLEKNQIVTSRKPL